jgi:hypothetical protein
MTPAQFHLWVGDQLLLVCFVGVLVILFMANLERIARRRGWRFVLRLMPAIAIGLLILALGIAEEAGAVRIVAGLRQVAWMPYCEDWFYYVQPACWFI